MKKILLLFLFTGILCFSAGFNLDGYENFKWGTDKKTVIKALGDNYKVVTESKKDISSITYDEKIKVGDLELSGVKLLFKNEKLSEWDAWESMSLENFMKVVGTYVAKYGDNFYFSDYGESGCTFTYFGSQGLIQIGGKMNKEKKGELNVTVLHRIAYTEEEKKQWLEGYYEHKELSEAAGRAIKKGQDFIFENSNPNNKMPDRTVK